MDGIVKKLNKYNKRKRRGAGAIIGGVILAAILLTTVLVYFMTILNNEKTRTGLEIRAQQEAREKGTETYLVERALTVAGGNLDIAVVNKGPISMVASHALVYCESGCIDPPSEPIQTMVVSKVLNSGDSVPESAGGGLLIADNNHRYRIDVISERGNIVSSITCTVQTDGSCSEDSSDGGEPCIECAVTEGIIQGTGTVQLDFKSFGAIYPQLGNRDGVDQRGWDTKVTSKFSSAKGYPGFQLMTTSASGGTSRTDVVLVEVARNLDSTGDLTLTRNTGMNPSAGQVQGTPPDFNYICKENGKSFTPYNENTANKQLPSVSVNDPMTVGWQELYFCSTSPGATGIYWQPRLPFNNLNPIFLVARGDFANGAPYAQTIPYQALTIGKYTPAIINTCLLTADTVTSCPAIGFNQVPSPDFRYTALESEMRGPGVTIWMHVNTGVTLTDGIDVRWLYPDGTYTTLLSNQPATILNNPNRNFPVTLPIKESDGSTDITCSGGPGTSEYYTLVFNDGRDAAGDRYIYYFTFRMDC